MTTITVFGLKIIEGKAESTEMGHIADADQLSPIPVLLQRLLDEIVFLPGSFYSQRYVKPKYAVNGDFMWMCNGKQLDRIVGYDDLSQQSLKELEFPLNLTIHCVPNTMHAHLLDPEREK